MFHFIKICLISVNFHELQSQFVRNQMNSLHKILPGNNQPDRN